jgi:cytochrome b561
VRPSSTHRFDTVTLWLHWVTAALVLAQFATALSLDHVAPSQIDGVLGVHRSTGVLLWLLTAARLAWRASLMQVPPPDDVRLRRLAARTVEYCLYLLLLVQPATGLADTVFRAHGFSLFGLAIPPLVARSKAIYHVAHSLHAVGGWLLASLIGLHSAAALFHGLVLRDQVLQAMLPRLGGGPAITPATDAVSRPVAADER